MGIRDIKHNYISLSVLVTCLVLSFSAHAQYYIKGQVIDKSSKTPISHVSVLELETFEATDTDSNGYFSIKIYDTSRAYHLSFLHNEYETVDLTYQFSHTNLCIEMENLQTIHDEVVIKTSRQKYRNKNNPAVELIRKVIDRRHENDILKIGTFQSEQYEKTNIGVSRVPKFLTHNFILKPFRFVFENYDTVSYPGHKNLTIFLEENWSTTTTNLKKNKFKKRIHHQKKLSLDPDYINEEGTVARVKHLYQDINIYDNNLILVTNNFLSPIGASAPQFYKYFILDTVTTMDAHRLVRLRIEPRNSQDLLLFGEIVIDIDNNYSVQSYALESTKATNINFVDKVKIVGDYRLEPHISKYYLSEFRNEVIFSLYYKSNRKMIGSRHIKTTHFTSAPHIADTVFTDPPIEYIKEHVNNKADSTFYKANRTIPFTVYEQRTYDNIDSMKQMPYFKNLIDWGSAVTSGYKKWGKFDIGPYYRFYSYNDVEKNRFRFGVRTNPTEFDRFFGSAYLAYATGNQDFRYNLLGIYSIKNKRIYAYPMSYIQLLVQKDMKLQGRIGEISVQDNLIESIQRSENNKFLLVRNFKLDFVQEFKNNFVVSSYAMYNHLKPEGALYFTKSLSSSEIDTISHLNNTAIGVNIRWSPKEIIFNDRTQRSRLHSQSPIYTLGIEKGFEGIYQSSQDYWKFTASVTKRNLLGNLGILDFMVGGKLILGEVDYPLLNVPRANQTYTFSGQSYNMMNNGEFISDKQIEMNVNYRMMGFIFNKLPGIKHLRLREVAGIKMIYGSLDNRNNPLYNSHVLNFPVDKDNLPYIYTFQAHTPYIEWNVGIENIFKFLRIDYVRRVNYLHHRQVSKHGINASIIIDF